MKRIYFALAMILMIFNTSQAQKTIKGVLKDNSTNEAISNAYIHENNTDNIAITDLEGKFEIILKNDKSTLHISHINYKSTQVEIKNLTDLEIKLTSTLTQIDGVIIKGIALEDISHTTVVTDEIKQGSQIRNTAELFNDIPGFSLQKRSATALEPSFRSFKYEEMNMSFDGGTKVVHACPNRMDPITAHIIPEEVQKIEVIKGPYSVRFGQRFGPTVNLVTKSPTPEDYGFHGSIQAGYETNGNNILASGKLSYAQKLFDVSLNGETRNFGDYKDGNGITTPASFMTNSYSVKFGLNPSSKHRVVLDWRQKFGDNIKHAGLPMDSPKDDSYVLGLDYKYDKISKKTQSMSFKVYTSFVDHIMNNFERPNFATMSAETPVKSRTLGGKFETIFTPSNKFKVYTGLDADLIDRTGTKTVIRKKDMMGNDIMMPMAMVSDVWQDAVILDYGVFAEASFKINKVLSTTVGVRGDLVFGSMRNPSNSFLAFYGGEVEDKTDFTLGANASLNYRSKGWQVQFAYGRGTRTASMVERYIHKFTIGSDPYSYVGNPNLKPEINNQFELSFSKKLPKIHTGASAYYSIFENYITAQLNTDFNYMSMGSTVTPKQFVNVNADQFGFEAFFNYNFYKNVFFTSDIAYTSAYNKTFDEHLAQIAPLQAHLGLKYENKKYWADFRSEFVFAQKQFSTTFMETESPGYIVLDVRAGIKPVKDLTIGAAVLNLLNNDYYNHLNFSYKNSDINSGRVYEPGRSFSLFAKYKF